MASTDRRDPIFREWMSQKIKSIKNEHNLNIAQDEACFIENYLENMDPDSAQ